MDINVIINQVLLLFIPIAVGYTIGKLKVVDSSFLKNLSAFLYNVTLPCAVVGALQFEFDTSLVTKGIILVAVSVGIVLVCWALSGLFVKIFKISGATQGVARFALTFSNFSFMGYPIAEAFMGRTGLFYATVFSLPLYALVQSLGVAFVVEEGEKRGFRLKYILNPPMVGVYVGLILFATGYRFPAPIDSTIASLGGMTTPLAMVLVGMSLCANPLKTSFTDYKYYIIALFRLVVIPLGVYGVLTLLNVDKDISRTSTIITMMPVAANIIIVLSSRGLDASKASKAVLITVLLSVFTIPMFGALMF